VLDVGCGLGLCGLAAARRGADVTCVDVSAAAIAFVEASVRANGVDCTALCRDVTALAPSWRFDLVLAAEVAYDRAAFAELAEALVRHLRPGGTLLIADGHRTDTRSFYDQLHARGVTTQALELRVVEEGRAAPLRLTAALRPRAASG
jgi:2-polyprenyl-3-methyl-5-hydroxy-6-metoxy-1,4-benzoquinol methylase